MTVLQSFVGEVLRWNTWAKQYTATTTTVITHFPPYLHKSPWLTHFPIDLHELWYKLFSNNLSMSKLVPRNYKEPFPCSLMYRYTLSRYWGTGPSGSEVLGTFTHLAYAL